MLTMDDETQKLNAVVRLDVTFAEPDFITPWQNCEQFSGSGSGVVLAGQRILTNAHNITNASFISVSKPSSDESCEARVVAVDHDCDLALLEVSNPKFYEDIVPMEIGVTPSVRSEVQAVGYPMGGRGMSITQGIISRIEETEYAHSSCKLLTAQLDAAINPGNSGGPVMFDGKVAGIAFQGRFDGENIGYMIPTEIIRHFLTDLEDGHVDGFPSLFFKYYPLVNPDMRKAFKMRETHSGVLVYEVEKTAKSQLRPGDVLLGINGLSVTNNGNVRMANGELRTPEFLLRDKQVGETAVLQILRNGKERTLRQPMSRLPLLCRDIRNTKPQYFITGGLVFTALTRNLLKAFQSRAYRRRFLVEEDPRSEALKKYFQDVATSPKEELVILQAILVDKVNNGLQNCALEPVSEVNGVAIRNLKHLAELVDRCKSKAITFKLKNGVPIMLDTQKLREATSQILERYNVPNDRCLA